MTSSPPIAVVDSTKQINVQKDFWIKRILYKFIILEILSIPLFVKAMALEWTLSSIISFVVQTLKSVKTRCTSYSNLSKRIKLRIGLATPSLESVVLYSVQTNTLLIFSALSVTSICWISLVLEIMILRNPKIHSSFLDYSSMLPKIKWVVNNIRVEDGRLYFIFISILILFFFPFIFLFWT